MIERRSVLLATALAVFLLISVPSVIFDNAIRKYFNFIGHWNVAILKPTRSSLLPPQHPRYDRFVEPPQPELRFVKFSIKVSGAKEVGIAGDFNKWNAGTLPLSKKDKTHWETMIPLPPGRYKYLCLIDGQEVLDPLNPDTDTDSGRKVSVLTVK